MESDSAALHTELLEELAASDGSAARIDAALVRALDVRAGVVDHHAPELRGRVEELHQRLHRQTE